MLDTIVRDIRHSIRALRNSPGFTAIAIFSLALGIGANTAIFSLIDAVMLKSLPVRHPEELLEVSMGTGQFFSNPMWEQIRDRQDVFSGILAYGRWNFNLAPGGEVRYVNGHFVSGQYFETLGVRAAIGRTLTAADDKRGCVGAAVLSDGLWQREYGPDILGQTIFIDHHPIKIVGVAQPGFTGVEVGTSVDVMVPICAMDLLHGEISYLDVNGLAGGNIAAWLKVIGRTKPGISASQAAARMKTLAPHVFEATLPRSWLAADRDQYLHRTLTVGNAANGLSFLRKEYRQALTVLLATAALVLLIACCNIANLLLARGAGRQRETAIRMALGAGRGRLIRQLLIESLLLSGAGAALGVLFAKWGTRLLLVGLHDVYLDLTPDVRVLGFTAGVAVLTGLLFGVAPAWRGTRVQPQAAMKANARGVIEGSKFGLGKALVMAQVALSLVLVAGAGLLLSTFSKLASLDAGFDRDHILLTSVDLRSGHYPQAQWGAVYQEMLEKLRAIPGVRSASVSNVTPVCHCRWSDEVVVDGYPEVSTVSVNQVSDRYFETLGIAIVAGRDFDRRDTPTSPKVAIVSQSMARKYFGAANPLGRRYRVRRDGTLSDPVEIVGIVRDVKYSSLREEDTPTAFVAWSQGATPGPLTSFEVRVAGGAPTALTGAVKSVFAGINPALSIEFTTLTAKVNESIARERLLATLAGLFGGLALLLAMIGLYGVMSYNVTRRRNEIGIRMALGARPGRVLGMVLGEVAAVTGAGLAVGLGVALATTRFVASFVYGVTPNDPVMLALAVAVLTGVAAVAGYWPARRASRVDPMIALREE